MPLNCLYGIAETQNGHYLQCLVDKSSQDNQRKKGRSDVATVADEIPRSVCFFAVLIRREGAGRAGCVQT